ncbi:DUF448 domain-containing protein [Sulfuricurvum sp.]|uniref:DUF448 domain-containing protein n=1 Tax=Sulfuricurvum sp. TaxID=2025608 RepID=UPI0026244615|nr:DUF448 domain-containing protein [Sulfuricurvum sp.]MDD2265379.1 DUF448 domain-containing protein [Sulfuricurvum sp.]MDD2784457.1 DUF448 domain-containing protein [Sulfuricurvum sp.]
MAQKLHQPIRMCVVCRERFAQSALVRLQCREGLLQPYDNEGRSFYLCLACVEHKKTPGQLARQCKNGATVALMNRLKEIIVNDG